MRELDWAEQYLTPPSTKFDLSDPSTFKRPWLDALRSGKYPQAKGRLMKNGGYCCLGVLAEVAVEAGVMYRKPDPYFTGTSAVYNDGNDLDGWIAALPHSILEHDFQNALIRMNDEQGADFCEIADYIERNL